MSVLMSEVCPCGKCHASRAQTGSLGAVTGTGAYALLLWRAGEGIPISLSSPDRSSIDVDLLPRRPPTCLYPQPEAVDVDAHPEVGRGRQFVAYTAFTGIAAFRLMQLDYGEYSISIGSCSASNEGVEQTLRRVPH